MGAVLSPSDVQGMVATLRIGGRVVAVAPDSGFVLGDALARVRVRLATAETVHPGDLVVVEGVCRDSEISDGQVVCRLPAPETTGESEYARLGWNGVGSRLLARANALGVVRRYFAAHRFIEVDTPIRVASPQLDAGLEAIAAAGGWLVASPEYHMKRLLTGGLPRIFQLVHCSRLEELGPWHEPEFMMLEWYRVFAGLDEVLRDTEEIVCEIVRELGEAPRILAPGSGLEVEVVPPFEQLTVSEAFLKFSGVRDVVDLAASDENRYFDLLVGEVEPAIARMRRPVFLRDYPRSQAALARPKSDNPGFVDRVELYLGGIELCNGYEELTDPQENAARLLAESEHRRAQGQQAPLDSRFLAALREGMPPASGNALGLDRLIALALGAAGIAEVQAFPLSWR